jgi:hypothetical protein
VVPEKKRGAPTIVEGAGDADQIQGRVNQIRAEIDNSDSDYDREKLQNAASIAALFLTTEAVVADKPEKEKASAPAGADTEFCSPTTGPGPSVPVPPAIPEFPMISAILFGTTVAGCVAAVVHAAWRYRL